MCRPEVEFLTLIHPASKRTKGIFRFSVRAAVSLLYAVAATANPPPSRGASPANETRTVRVMDYTALSAPITVVFRYTALVPGAAGQAEILPSRIALRIHAAFSKLPPASRLGTEYLTYVLWAVTPEGRASNLGEIELTGADGRLNTKMAPSRFGLIVTAEPYFAVSHPGNAVVFEADLSPGATPTLPVTQATCELLSAAGADLADPGPPAGSDPAAPLVIEEARRAIAVAQKSGAQELAAETLATAEHLLQLTRDLQARGAPRKDVVEAGSEAVLVAEDARVLSVKRRKQSRQGSVITDSCH
ncbi:MAG TPA: hypothetical protein VG206_12030 [Terriglobia bacterium]|nr:hypothetical protein [Terriglobia bacterium]